MFLTCVFFTFLGRVVYKTKPSLKIITTKREIYGVTQLDNEIYLASNAEIEVYDSKLQTVKCTRTFSVGGLVLPWDIKSSAKNSCLYIMDRKDGLGNEIFASDRNGKVMKKWSIEKYGHLSVTEEGTAVLAIYHEAKIVEYSHDGCLIREVCLSEAGVQNLWHAIKLRDGNFVVSFGNEGLLEARTVTVEKSNKPTPNRPGVAIIDSRGIILKESSNLQLSVPLHLDIDRYGYILVADNDQGCVFLLNSDLEYEREIVSHADGVDAPTAICLCTSARQLLVADKKDTFHCFLAFEIC